MKLEVGMYVRTKLGEITKIIDIRRPINADILIFSSNLKEMFLNELGLNILKSSYNLIDLIEVGDYVNDSKVIEVYFDVEEEKYIRIDKAQDGLKTILRNNDIKSIVTKEQFESMKYSLEG